MAEFQFVKQGGGLGTVEAASADLAVRNLPKDAKADTGVMATDVPVLSTESAVDDVKKAQETERALTSTSLPTDESATTETKKRDTSTEDIAKIFGGSDKVSEEQVAELTPAGQKARQELDTIVAGLDTFKISNAELQTEINSIVRGYDARIKQFENINQRREKTFETLGFRTGGQFTGGVRGGVFGGIIAEEERQGLMRINQLEAQKQAEIVAAKESARSKNWQVYVQQIQQAEQKYKEQIENIKQLNKLYIDKQNEMEAEEQALQKTERTITRDRAIADLMAQGITDPAQMLDYLNFSEAGELVGDITLKEITDTIKLLEKTNSKKTNDQYYTPESPLSFEEYAAQRMAEERSVKRDGRSVVENKEFLMREFMREYDQLYGSGATTTAPVPKLTNLTPSNKRDLEQARLVDSDPNMQRFYIATPSSFKQFYQRNVALGTTAESLEEIAQIYNNWLDEKEGDKKKETETTGSTGEMSDEDFIKLLQGS